MSSRNPEPDDPAVAGAVAGVEGGNNNINNHNGRKQPCVLIASHVLMGHLAPMLRIARALRSRWRWRVFFLGPTAERTRIEASGATFLPLLGAADIDGRAYYESPPVEGYAALPWHERVLVDLESQCFDTIPDQWSSLLNALRTIRRREPERRVLVLAEAFFHGVLPLRYGAPLPPDLAGEGQEEVGARPRSICVSVTIPAIRSRDLPPLGYPFPFDTSAEGRARNARLWERSWMRRTERLSTVLLERLREAGVPRAADLPPPDLQPLFAGVNYLCHERVLQLGVPGFEYPRTDWPPGFRFAGLVQGPPNAVNATGETGDATSAVAAAAAQKQRDPDPDFPWWSELVANSALDRDDPRRKKVVVVTQGTVEINPEDLILPTIRAFTPSGSTSDPEPASTPPSSSPRLDPAKVLVVAILGWKDSRLPAALARPPVNVRVADYLTYDAALSHADAWVHNGGFGAVCHGLAHGVPQVVAGEGMDKGENAARVARSGCGVDLRTGRPGPDAVARAVADVLLPSEPDGRFPFVESAARLRAECEGLDAFRVVHEELCRLAGNDVEFVGIERDS